jgi:hypothetical protein
LFLKNKCDLKTGEMKKGREAMKRAKRIREYVRTKSVTLK